MKRYFVGTLTGELIAWQKEFRADLEDMVSSKDELINELTYLSNIDLWRIPSKRAEELKATIQEKEELLKIINHSITAQLDLIATYQYELDIRKGWIKL